MRFLIEYNSLADLTNGHAIGTVLRSSSSSSACRLWSFVLWLNGASETVRDKGLAPKNHQQEMTYGLSNGHVTDDVAWPRRWCEAVRWLS